VQHDFSVRALATSDWDQATKALEDKIKYFKRIGAGTDLSKAVQESSKQLKTNVRMKFKKTFSG